MQDYALDPEEMQTFTYEVLLRLIYGMMGQSLTIAFAEVASV